MTTEEKVSKIFESRGFSYKEKYGNCLVYLYKNFKIYCYFNSYTEEVVFRHIGKKYFNTLEELLRYYKKRFILEIKVREKAICNYNLLLQQIDEIREKK